MPHTMSPSSLSLFLECPRCFWLQLVKGIKRPAAPFPTLPTGMDRILKEHFDRFRDRGELPPELAQLRDSVELFKNAALLEVWRNWRQGIQWQDGAGNILKGAVDNILQRGHKLIALDYKTKGSAPNENSHTYSQHQLDIYTFLLQKNGFDTEDYAYLLFYYPDKVLETGEVIFNTELVKVKVSVENAEELFKKALELLAGEKPAASAECGFCRLLSSS